MPAVGWPRRQNGPRGRRAPSQGDRPNARDRSRRRRATSSRRPSGARSDRPAGAHRASRPQRRARPSPAPSPRHRIGWAAAPRGFTMTGRKNPEPQPRLTGHYAGPVTRLVSYAIDAFLVSALFSIVSAGFIWLAELVTGNSYDASD